MPDTSPIRHFRDTLAAIEQGQPAPPEATAWFVAWGRSWLARAEAGAPISMEAAAGLKRNWAKRQAFDERDAALRELYRTRLPELTPRQAARAILALKPCPCPMLGERRLDILGK